MVIAILLISIALALVIVNATSILIEIFFETIFDFIKGGNENE